MLCYVLSFMLSRMASSKTRAKYLIVSSISRFVQDNKGWFFNNLTGLLQQKSSITRVLFTDFCNSKGYLQQR